MYASVQDQRADVMADATYYPVTGRQSAWMVVILAD